MLWFAWSYLYLLDNGVMTTGTPKHQILFFVFTGLCFKKSLLVIIKNFFLLLEWSDAKTASEKIMMLPWLKRIIWVIGVLRSTVICDWCFDNVPVQKPSSESSDRVSLLKIQKPWPVTNNSPSPDSSHPDLFQPRYVTPGFKPFSYNDCYCSLLTDRFEEVAKSIQVSAF